MSKFFKSVNRDHPGHTLPTVEWRDGKPYFEFIRGESGLLEFETDDAKLAEYLRERGYGEEAPPPVVDPGAGATVSPVKPQPVPLAPRGK